MTPITRFARDIHYLYPEVIYRFSALFLAFWESHQLKSSDVVDGINMDNKDAYVIPAFFSKKTRTSHWVGIHSSSMWNWNTPETQEMFKGLLDELIEWRNTHDSLWRKFLDDMPVEIDIYKKSGDLLTRLTNSDINFQDFEELHRAILTLYSGYHQHAEKNIEGVYYRFLKKCNNHRELDYLLGKLEKENVDSDSFDWFFIDPLCCRKSNCLAGQWQSLHDENCSGNKKPPQNEIKIHPLAAIADNIMLKWMLLTPKDFGIRLGNHPHIIVTPIHDVVIGGRGYGGIKGVIALFFKDTDKRAEWINNKYKMLVSTTPELAGEISASAETLAGSVPITPPYDLLKHFLKVLIYVQDWEEAVVFKNSQIEYGFKRKPPKDDNFKWGWEKYENKQFMENPEPGKHESDIIYRIEEKCYLWWNASQNGATTFWSKDLIPGLGEEELSRFEDISIRFEFPEACHIPTDDNDLKFFADTYLRQQLDLMRMLIPKVRSRRAALRSAVSAIMGRNLSHNIGSHVLARYSSAVGRMSEQRKSVAGRGTDDHRAVFLRYLQRRMDFIAEVSTSEKSFWSQPLALNVVLSALNLGKELDRINGKGPDKLSFKPILLSYISGKEGMNATVEASAIKGDPYFACPGGEMGAHALYVILENIIRNSARHNANFNGKLVTVEVKLEEEKDDKDFWRFTLIDCQSKLEGKSTQKDMIGDINKKINDEPILNQDGSPNPKYWGIREMQICAQYLRGLPTSDLEGFAAKLPVLEAISQINGDGKKCLAYRIYLQRAKLCALIPAQETLEVDELSSGVDELNKKLKPKGIKILHSVSDTAQLQGYSFVLVEDTVAEMIDKEAEATATDVTDKSRALQFKGSDKEKPIPLLQLPVRSMLVDTDFMKARLTELNDIANIIPEHWLEALHERLWKTYRDKRDKWKDKPVKALVGWDEHIKGKNIIEQGKCPDQLFCHARIADGKECDDSKKEQNYAYNCFGDAIKENNELGFAWVDHANKNHFAFNANPNLISAAKKFKGHFRPFIFSEFVESLSPHRPLLIKQEAGTVQGNELLAAAIARVIVLDERVQNEIDRDYRDLDYKVLWPCMGVWVPEKKLEIGTDKEESPATDLNQPSFDEIRRFLEKPACFKDQFPPDFLVLHLTILENLKKQRPEDKCEADTLAKLIRGTQVNKDCEVVIVTGRGAPSLSRHNGDVNALSARYLPISALLEYLLGRPSKLSLMRALWSAAAAC